MDMVYTGTSTMVINEDIRAQLGLEVERYKKSTLADGSKKTYAMTEPVEIQWKERTAVCRTLVMPTTDKVLLGAIPLEEMDLIICPSKLELVGAHGDREIWRV